MRISRRTPHLSTNPGKRIRLKLRDGSFVEGKFIEHKGNAIVVVATAEGNQRFHAKEIDKFIVVKSIPKEGFYHGNTACIR